MSVIRRRYYVGWLLVLCLALSGCVIIDNIMLGKDNVPKPATPMQVDKHLTFVSVWQQPFAPRRGTQAGSHLNVAFSGKYVYTASANGYVQCRDKYDGQLVWQTNLNTGIASGPTVGEGMIAVGGSDAYLMVLSKKDGRLRWKHALSNQLLAPPVIAHHRVFTKTIDGQLDAFDSARGQRIWHYSHGAPEIILKANSAPIVDQSRLYAGFSDGSLEALDWQNGELLWRRQVGFSKGSSEIEQMVDIDTTPLLHAGKLYVSSYQGETVSLTADNGHMRWHKPIASHQDMALVGERLFVVADDGRIWAIGTSSGALLWQQQGLMYHQLFAPTLIAGGLVVADRNGYAHALASRQGTIIASQRLFDVPIIAPAVIDDGHLYVMTANGMLSKFAIRQS